MTNLYATLTPMALKYMLSEVCTISGGTGFTPLKSNLCANYSHPSRSSHPQTLSLFLASPVIVSKKGRNRNEINAIRSSHVIVEGTKRQIMAYCRPFRADRTSCSLRQQASRPRISDNQPVRPHATNQADVMAMDRRKDEPTNGQEQVSPHLNGGQR